MGTDGPGIYDNDGAADAVTHIEAEGLVAVRDYLKRVNDFGEESVWSNVAEGALPAIDVVAHLMSGVPAIRSMVEGLVGGFSVNDAALLVEPATSALEKISRPGSGLRLLWDESVHSDDWLATLDDLRHRLNGNAVDRQLDRPAFMDFVDFSAGDVLVVPLDPDVSGVEGMNGVVLVRSVMARKSHEVLVAEILVADLFWKDGESHSDPVPVLSSDLILEGARVPMNGFSYSVAGRIADFDIDEWPMLLDDHSLKPSSNPYPLAERWLEPSKHQEVYRGLQLDEGLTLADISRDFFGRPWVPFTRGPLQRVLSHVYDRHHGSSEPFPGNGKMLPIRRRRS